MDFEWSESQTSLYASALSFARERLPKAGAQGDPHGFPREAWSMCGEFGLLGLSAPSSFGGMDLDALTTARVFEAFGLGCDDVGLLFGAAAHLFACVMPIVHHGSDLLKDKVLAELATGRRIGANAMTEAQAGTDIFSLATTASKDGDHYILDGAKTYVTNGPEADVYIVYATTNRALGYMGSTAFAVLRDTPGVTVGKAFDKIGLHSATVGSVYFDGCRVPAGHVLGAEGQGALVFRDSMAWERACLFGFYLGVMQRQLDETIAYAKERKQGKQPIGKYQAVSHRIVEMKLRLDAARLLLYRACWILDRGGDATLEVSMSKIAVAEAAVENALDAIRIHGGAGVASEFGVERGIRDAIPGLIFSGTQEIQKNLVASRLGL